MKALVGGALDFGRGLLVAPGFAVRPRSGLEFGRGRLVAPGFAMRPRSGTASAAHCSGAVLVTPGLAGRPCKRKALAAGAADLLGGRLVRPRFAVEPRT